MLKYKRKISHESGVVPQVADHDQLERLLHIYTSKNLNKLKEKNTSHKKND